MESGGINVTLLHAVCQSPLAACAADLTIVKAFSMGTPSAQSREAA